MTNILNMMYDWMTENSITWDFNNNEISMTWWSLFIALSVISLAIMIVEKILDN